MQRLVVPLVGRFAHHLPRRQSTLRRAEKYQPPKPKTRNRAETLRRHERKEKHQRAAKEQETPATSSEDNPKLLRFRSSRALQHNAKLTRRPPATTNY